MFFDWENKKVGFSELHPAGSTFFAIEAASQILDQLCIEVLFVIGPVVNSQLAVNLGGQCLGLEAISNQ
ncbi:hypothetical protein [Prochlorococcus sp. MIT 1303]|uniref:hypothetical protein n=1 Tax=Prochlorococcus sp. MIT 1303 TaxID=1723647 RepID=UPI0007B322E5|nr:hypothetical protein [Prochlorococcus sp. MIT 1303]